MNRESGPSSDDTAISLDRSGFAQPFFHTLVSSPLEALYGLLRSTGCAVMVVQLAVKPSTWRRTVRAVLARQVFAIGVKGLFSVMVTGLLVGVVVVAQVLYWFSFAGETDAIGDFVAWTLVRNTTPILVGLLVIGRSGMLMMTEVGNMQARGQLHMLNARGIEPFIYVVVPRVVAAAISVFCLSVAFITVALFSGFVYSNAAGVVSLGFPEFTEMVLGALGPLDAVMLPVKTLLIGFLIGLIACLTALEADATPGSVRELLPHCFVRSMLATLITVVSLSVVIL